MPKPSDALLQHLTFSSYYGGNIAKGGVMIQLSGWIGARDLWTGAVLDTDFLKQTNILDRQNDFLQHDFVNGELVPFTNILDKGYRVVLAAWRKGKQFVLQPTFAKSDTKFTGRETLSSAAVAADRAANERAVRLCKMLGLLRQGFKQRSNFDTVSDVWLAWSFQVNFMFKPVT